MEILYLHYINAGEISEMSVLSRFPVENTALKLGKLITLGSNTNINKFPWFRNNCEKTVISLFCQFYSNWKKTTGA